jgi:uncharacterized protein YceH (UPF0502 family)
MNEISQLNFEEIRILGALIEKSKTTPDYYPMTLNGLVTACNQKSSRNPVVSFDNETVILALDSLKKKQLIANVIGDGRTLKYRHTLAVKYPIDPAEVSVLCLLFLRGDLTAGEINSNSGRLHEYESISEVVATLNQLMSYEFPFVKQLPKITGQKEGRYTHLFKDPELLDNMNDHLMENETFPNINLEERLAKVEAELNELKNRFNQLMDELS